MAGKFVSWTLNVVKEIREIEPSKLYGVGVSLSITASPTSTASRSQVVVSAIHPSGPASKCLQSNDVILVVNDTDIDEKASPQDVAKLIRGPEGSEVSVVVERSGELMEFKLRRERIGPMADGLTSPEKKADVSCDKVEKKEEELRLSEDADDGKQQVRKLSVEDLPVEFKQVECAEDTPPASKQEETIEKDLTSSNESSDQFIEQHFTPPLTKRKSFDTHSHSEEKSSHDELENCSIINSTDGEHWEFLSATSGSAVVISFSGSLRSASPSVLCNKFILSESTGEEYMDHVVLPTDTLQGLCLAYKTSATRLRMINGFSGNSLQLAPKKLRIPISKSGLIRIQDTSSKEYKLYAFNAEMPTMELVEAKAYLDLSNWDLDEAIRSAKEDDGWNIRGDTGCGTEDCGGGDDIVTLDALARPKALTANDIYAVSGTFYSELCTLYPASVLTKYIASAGTTSV